MTNKEIIQRRLANQRLVGNALETPAEIVELLGAVQSQDYAGAKWGIGQRLQNGTDAALDAAFNAGELLRIHILRPTWHFVSPKDIRWMLELTAPRVNQFTASMYRRYELDEPVFKKSNALLVKALRDGKYKTRAELGAVLEQNGISAKDGVRLAHLMMRAELDGVVCSGARRGKQFTYALLAERAPNAKTLKRDEALAELTRRYFSTRGPATAHDFAWWSGLTLGDAKKGLELSKEFWVSEKFGEQTLWFTGSPSPKRKKLPAAFLLPNYDEYFIGFQDRRAFGERVSGTTQQEIAKALYVHIVFINGEIVGGWRRTLEKNAVALEFHLLTALTAAEQKAVRTAAERFARFLGLKLGRMTHSPFDIKGRDLNLFS